MVRVLTVFAALAVMGRAQNAFRHLFLNPDKHRDACTDCLDVEQLIHFPEEDLPIISAVVCDAVKELTSQQCRDSMPSFFVSACGTNCIANASAVLKDFKTTFEAAGRDMKKVCADRGYCKGAVKSTKKSASKAVDVTRQMNVFNEHATGSMAAVDVDCDACINTERFLKMDNLDFALATELDCLDLTSKPKDECTAAQPPMFKSVCDGNCTAKFDSILTGLKESYDQNSWDIRKACSSSGFCKPDQSKKAITIPSINPFVCEECLVMEQLLKLGEGYDSMFSRLTCEGLRFVSRELCEEYLPSFLRPACDAEKCAVNLVAIIRELRDAYEKADRDMEKVCLDRGYCTEKSASPIAISMISNAITVTKNEVKPLDKTTGKNEAEELDDCKSCIALVKPISFDSMLIPQWAALECTEVNYKDPVMPKECQDSVPPMFASLCEQNCTANYIKILTDVKESYEKEDRNIMKACTDLGYCKASDRPDKMTVMSKVALSDIDRRSACVGCSLMADIAFLEKGPGGQWNVFADFFCDAYRGQSKDECSQNIHPLLLSACDEQSCTKNVVNAARRFRSDLFWTDDGMQTCCALGYCTKEKRTTEDCQACRELNSTLHMDENGINRVSDARCYEMSVQTAEICRANWPSFISHLCGEEMDQCFKDLIKIYTDLKADFEKDGSDIAKFCIGKKFCAPPSSSSNVFLVVFSIIGAVISIAAVFAGIFLLHRKRAAAQTSYGDI